MLEGIKRYGLRALLNAVVLVFFLLHVVEYQRWGFVDRMENLAYELLKSEASQEKDAILSRIQAINEARNLGIVGKPSSAEPEPVPEKTQKIEPAEEASEPTK